MVADLGPFRPSLVVSFYQRGARREYFWEILTCVPWNLGVYLHIVSRGWCFLLEISEGQYVVGKRAEETTYPRPLWSLGITERNLSGPLAPWEKVWSEKGIRLCDVLRWGEWVQVSLVWLHRNKASHLQGPGRWIGSGWSCPLTESTSAPLWGDCHVDKGNWQPTESLCNDRVAVLQPCHQASDHFPPSPQFQRGDTFQPTFGFPLFKVLRREEWKWEQLPSKFPEPQAQLVRQKGKGFKVDMGLEFPDGPDF